MLKTVRARAPLRLGLYGGGTDVSPYCDEFGGVVINSTIDKYAYVTIKDRVDNKIVLKAEDLKINEENSLHEFLESKSQLKLHKTIYLYMVERYNNNNYLPLSITSYCEVPPGSGLGSSSTLVVTIIKAFIEYFAIGLDDYQISKLAYKFEREICKIKGGKQDQYAATFGGFNLMEFYNKNKVIVTPLKIKNWIMCEFEASLLIYFTGASRDSSFIIEDQISQYKKHSSNILENMHLIKKETYLFKELLLKGDFENMSNSIKKSWLSKKMTSKKISNEKIDHIYESAISEGALAGKVSGAGGGGFMWFIVDPEKKIKVINKLNEFDGYVSNCKFTEKGCESWTL